MAQENYHHDRLKSELIEKGLKLLDEEGYEGFSLRKVAKACNVSHAAPYRHFKNKDELILAISMEAMQKFSQSLQEAVDKYPYDPKDQLKEMGCSYIRFFADNPEYLRLMFLSDIKNRIGNSLENPDECFANQKSGEHPFEILYKAVERYNAGIQKNAGHSMEQDVLVLYCWGLVHGVSILIARKEFPYEGDYMELARKVLWSIMLQD